MSGIARAGRDGWPRPTRRRALGGALVLGGGLVLSACGTDTSDRYDTGFVSGDGVTAEIPRAERGDPITFTGTTYEGEEFSSADVQGEVLVLNVWYAACAPCRAEAPDLKDIAEEYADEGVQFLGINVRDEKGPALAFEEKYGIPYPSIPDLDASIMYQLRGQVAPNAVPSTLVLDDQGRAAARISGLADPSVLRSMIDTVLAE